MKRELLYLTPVVPSLTGNGLAMRAGMVLEALSAHFDITVLAVTMYSPVSDRLPDPLAGLCRRTAVVDQPRTQEPGLAFWKREAYHRTCDEFRRLKFDTMHVFRLAMLPHARPFFECAKRRHLDLDDIESVTRTRIAELARANGDAIMTAMETAGAMRSQPIERQVCQEFDRIYVCSAEDRARLLQLGPRAEIHILPNAVRVPASTPPVPNGEPFSFLFAGTLGYYPNADAVRYLAGEIVPRIRQLTNRAFELRVVGTGGGELRGTIERAGMIFDGEVPEMLPSYARASALLVPLRAGGGTRIKILESWSYRRPVVTTSVGIEGLPGRHGEHVLAGDTPGEFAAQCVRLMEDPALRERLACAAHALLLRCYTAEVIQRTIGEWEASRSR